MRFANKNKPDLKPFITKLSVIYEKHFIIVTNFFIFQ